MSTARQGLDPAPRKYPPAVMLVRRAARGREAAPSSVTPEEVEAWLLADASSEQDMLALFETFVWRLVAARLPLDRASLHVGTLHPQLFGFAWNWNSADGFADEMKVAEGQLQHDSYRRNPLYRVIEHGETIRRRTDAAAAEEFPLIAELARTGTTEYLALPLSGAGYHNAATVATNRPGGFAEEDIATLRRLLALFALHVERHIALRIARNALDVYLGSLAAGKVLSGSIRRGSGEAIRAVVWISDLRGFTDLSGRLAAPDMIALLNAYFERMAGAVLAQGGEVLKFIGDGLLAVFPVDPEDGGRSAARAALAAAEEAVAGLAGLNAEPPPPLDAIPGWRPLRSGIALHLGEVFFGNIGAPERLDFTAIGGVVNEASRVEALQKELGHAILITEPVARHLDRRLLDLGRHALRGVSAPIGVYGLAEPS